MSGPGRLASLDAFRGFTIAAMVLVNNPGDWSHLYSQLAHAKWNGWTFTDTIFPFFLFIGGVSMALSLGRLAAAGADKPQLLLKLAKRACLIFLIGFLLNLIPHFNLGTVRSPGVLQRIALCTLLAAPIVVYCSWRSQLVLLAVLLGRVQVGAARPIDVGDGGDPGRAQFARGRWRLVGGRQWRYRLGGAAGQQGAERQGGGDSAEGEVTFGKVGQQFAFPNSLSCYVHLISCRTPDRFSPAPP